MTGLPLSDRTPSPRVIIFPVQRRIGRIRRVAASLLAKKSDRTATIEWERVVRSVSEQLARIGMSDAAIHQYLSDFREAVEIEMRRQTGASRRDGGAA